MWWRKSKRQPADILALDMEALQRRVWGEDVDGDAEIILLLVRDTPSDCEEESRLMLRDILRECVQTGGLRAMDVISSSQSRYKNMSMEAK